MKAPTSCLRCQGPMDEGFVLDRAHYNAPTDQRWVEGAPEPNFWTGIKTKGKEQFSVRTYRCERCGYLESYAVELAPK